MAVDARALANADAIATLDGRVTGTMDTVVRIGADLTASSARDDAQDVKIADNAQRIEVINETAVTARAETATLRADVDAGRAGLVRQADTAAPVTVATQTGRIERRLCGHRGRSALDRRGRWRRGQ